MSEKKKKSKKENIDMRLVAGADSTLSIDSSLIAKMNVRNTYFLFSLLKARLLRRKLSRKKE